MVDEEVTAPVVPDVVVAGAVDVVAVVVVGVVAVVVVVAAGSAVVVAAAAGSVVVVVCACTAKEVSTAMQTRISRKKYFMRCYNAPVRHKLQHTN